MENFDLKQYLAVRRKQIDDALERFLPSEASLSGKVMEAMRYSVMAGGKRVRPILLLAGAEAVGCDTEKLLPAACALECIHTYSLIHDDLPAMDDDELRRGRKTCHVVFGEAIAILAGDGLLTLAFELMTSESLRSSFDPAVLNKAISMLAQAAGVFGMVGGQTADILMEGKPVDADTLRFIHRRKTGALLRVSVELGGYLGGGSEKEVASLAQYGTSIGLAFQVVDDLLDIEGDEVLTGKPVGSDEKNAKATYPALYGLERTKEMAKELLQESLDALEIFGSEAEPLRAIANYVVTRKR
jgi:geranylgeranyl diphosphate synthase type II